MGDQFDMSGNYQGATVNIKSTIVRPPAPPLPPYTPPPPPAPGVLPAPGPLPPDSHLPLVRNALFTGRTKPLLALAKALGLEEWKTERMEDRKDGLPILQSSSLPVLVSGMGGIGKTQLAVELCYRYGRFTQGVHWLNAAEPDGIAAEVAACGREMCLPGWPDALPEQVAFTLRAWAAAGPRLVVLDNLEDVPAAAGWLPRLAVGGVRLLVTARRQDWPRTLGLAPLPLDVFSPAESRAFLREYLPPDRALDGELDALSARLGRLPLALELAGRYLAGLRRLTVGEYLAAMAGALADPAMTGWQRDLPTATGHDLSLVATFAVSWQRVADPGARRVFALAAYCAPSTPIPVDVLDLALRNRPAETVWQRLVRPLRKKPPTVNLDVALNTLVGLGLLEWNVERTGAGPIIHPLLSEYGRTLASGLPRSGKPGSSPLAALAAALACLSYDANATGLPARFVPLRPHVEAAAGHAAEGSAAGLAEAAGVMWNNLGSHRQDVADYAGARAAYERALHIWEQTPGSKHPQIATCVNNLGNALRELGDLAGARAAFERALRIDEAAFGPDHSEVATDVNNLGLALRDLGDLTGARAAFERALRIDEAAFGPDHPTVARNVNNLGLVLHDLGELPAARAAFERALSAWEQMPEPEHPQVATGLNNLGLVLRDMGDADGARGAFERALRIDEAVYGPDHPAVARDVNSLGLALQTLGDLAGARAAYERALRVWENVLGREHPQVATGLNNVGLVLRSLGELAAARAALERALRLDQAAFESDHPTLARDANNLGLVLLDLGDLPGARAAFERAVRIWGKTLPPNHPHLRIARGNLESLGAG